MKRRLDALLIELGHHLPYTIISSLIATAAVWYVVTTQLQQHGAVWVSELRWTFHVLHPLHVCISAMTTTAVLWHFDRRLAKVLTIGVLGSVIPCGLSDYIVPFVGGKLLGQHMELHICLIDHPTLILPFLFLGLIAGLVFEQRISDSSVFSHGAHVFISSLAALFYLVSFGCTGWLSDIQLVFPVFLVVVIAVWIPCCISDIVIPVSAIHQHVHGGHHPVPRPSV